MKHFFRKHDRQDNILLSLFATEENQDFGSVAPISRLKEKLIKTGSDDNNAINEQFKIIYDATDIIYDKRFDGNYSKNQADQSKSNSKNDDSELDSFKYESKKALYPRERALMALWDYAEHELTCHKNMKDTTTAIYSCLARGNICLRLSNIYYDNYLLKESDMWGNRANELLWHGRNLIESLDFNPQSDTYKTNLTLKWLTDINLAKYYRDYASRNRRSDFMSAIRLFRKVADQIKEEWCSGHLNPVERNNNTDRQIAMLYIEANRNLTVISKYDNPSGCVIEALNFARNLYYSLLPDNKLSSDIDAGLNKEFKFLDPSHKSKTDQKTNADSTQSVSQGSLCIESYVDGYDAKRFLLLALLNLARVLRGEHKSHYYKHAILIAVIANKLSQSMDDPKDQYQHANIDALIIISGSLRKYCIFANTSTQESESSKISKITIEKSGTDIPLDNLFIILRGFASKGHLASKTELIKWFCMSFEDRKRYAQGYLSEILGWKSFPDIKYIDQLVSGKNQNALMEFYRGKMLLDTFQFEKAIKVLKYLINPDGIYCNVTYYVRIGTIGLKARYLLANAYMSQGKYYKAKCILEDIYKTLNQVSPQTDNGNNDNNHDLRVLIDLAYCYIKRGEFKKAFTIYKDELHLDENSGDIIKIDFLKKLPKYKRTAGINNLITCCILDNDSLKNEMWSIGEKLLIEINSMDKNNPLFSEFSNNPQTNLLRGYYELIKPDKDIRVAERYKKAHHFFDKLCQKGVDYRSQYSTSERNETDIGALYNNIEYISSYLINLINLYKTDSEQAKWAKDIKDFIKCLPSNRMLSLKAAIALANWLIENCPIQNKKSDVELNGAEKNKEYERLYRYFSYLKIYEERGASAFNELDRKNNGQFRQFQSVERGVILAHLLSLYGPINSLKEKCTYRLCEQNDSKNNPLVHYTTLTALKGIIGREKPTHFRLSNCGYANDVFEGKMFFDCLKKTVQKKSNDVSGLSLDVLKKLRLDYFGWTDEENRRSPHVLNTDQTTDSDVYIASFSQKTDFFPMWTIYSQEETGCNIEFGEGFFDVLGANHENKILNSYLPSRYTDRDYPLYNILYIKKDKTEESSEIIQSENALIEPEILLELLFTLIEKWINLDESLKEYISDLSRVNPPATTVRSFAADLINEIRFLFKNADFSYENEVRVVYTDTKKTSKTDYERVIPMNYVEMDRDIENLSITLGSKISYSDVDKIETWLKHTGLVKKINIASTNRLN